MPISPDYDYTNKLALDKAKLIGRSRINDLGAYELVIQYNNITSAMREDALEWLEANRLELTDPTFSFKTYEGLWKGVDITYNEDRSIMRQTFKVDVGIGDLGDWDGELPEPTEPTWEAQSGDLARISSGMELQRSYYWRVTNPEDVNLPTSPIEGQIWTKTANDNGDGTYDVTVGREVAQNLDATSVSQPGSVSNGAYTETSETNTNDDEKSFVGSGYGSEDVAVPTDGTTKRIGNTALENGKFRSEVTTREANNQTATSEVRGGEPSGAPYPGSYSEETETNTSDVERSFVGAGYGSEDVTVAIVGQIKRIENVPLENGKFRSTVTTRTAIAQRMPPESASGTGDYPWLEYSSDYITDANNLIVGRNQPWSQVIIDRDRMNTGNPAFTKINSMSVRVNDYGLFDYTIISNTPG